MPMINKAGRTGSFLPDTIVKTKIAINSPKVKKRTHGLVRKTEISIFLICSFFLIHVTPFITVLMGQIQPQ
jgi:hypothetical protein